VRACAALAGLHETVPYRALGGVQLRDARVLIDTGYEEVANTRHVHVVWKV